MTTSEDLIERPFTELLDPDRQCELNRIMQLPVSLLSAVTGGLELPRERAIKEFEKENSSYFEDLREKERLRIKRNFADMSIGENVRLGHNTTVLRVIGGWIYLHETYDNAVMPHLISKASTFVPESSAK